MAGELTITASDVRPVEIIEQISAPAAETVTAGAVAMPNTSGKLALTNASEAPVGFGVLINSAYANVAATLVRKGLVFLGAVLDSINPGTKYYLSTLDGKITATNPAANEKQTLTITGTPTGGTFTLAFGGATTSAIAYNATAATVQSNLEGLSSIGLGNVRCSGGGLPGTPVVIEFIQDLGKADQALIVADGASLTGGTTPTAAVAQTTAGVREIVVGVVEAIHAATTALKALRIG